MSGKRRTAVSPTGEAAPSSLAGPLVIEVSDCLDIDTADSLLERMRHAVSEATVSLTIDLGQAGMAHTAALQILVATARACAARPLPFNLRGVSPSLAEALTRAGLTAALGLPAAQPVVPGGVA